MQLAPDIAWGLIAVICAGTILAFLRILGFAYINAVSWHNLKVDVHRLRIAQRRRLLRIAMGEMNGRGGVSLPVQPDIEPPADAPTPGEPPEAPAEANMTAPAEAA